MNEEAYNAGFELMTGTIGILQIFLGIVGPVVLLYLLVQVLSLFADLGNRNEG